MCENNILRINIVLFCWIVSEYHNHLCDLFDGLNLSNKMLFLNFLFK